jgi:hypothetical protein
MLKLDTCVAKIGWSSGTIFTMKLLNLFLDLYATLGFTSEQDFIEF